MNYAFARHSLLALTLSPIIAAAAVTAVAPVNTEQKVINQLGNIQIIVGVVDYLNDIYQQQQAMMCRSNKGTVAAASLPNSPIKSLFATGADDSFNVARTTWKSCLLNEFHDDQTTTYGGRSYRTKTDITVTRTGRIDRAEKAFHGGSIDYTQFGESPAKPLVNTLGFKASVNGRSAAFDFTSKAFYRIEELTGQDQGPDQQALLYDTATSFGKYLTINAQLGDPKKGASLLVQRDPATHRVKAVAGIVGLSLAGDAAAKQGFKDCQASFGATKVTTLEPLQGNGFGSGLDGVTSFTGGKLSFCDPKAVTPTDAKKCAIVTFKSDDKMDVLPAGKLTATEFDQSNSLQDEALGPKCTAGLILGSLILFEGFSGQLDE